MRVVFFFFSSRRRHTRCALVTGVQTCALPICLGAERKAPSGSDARVAPYGAGRVSDYVALLKPRVMSLVVFTGFAGLYAAPGDLHPFLAAVAVLCIAVSAGAAAALNMWYEPDIDPGKNGRAQVRARGGRAGEDPG